MAAFFCNCATHFTQTHNRSTNPKEEPFLYCLFFRAGQAGVLSDNNMGSELINTCPAGYHQVNLWAFLGHHLRLLVVNELLAFQWKFSLSCHKNILMAISVLPSTRYQNVRQCRWSLGDISYYKADFIQPLQKIFSCKDSTPTFPVGYNYSYDCFRFKFT